MCVSYPARGTGDEDAAADIVFIAQQPLGKYKVDRVE